MNISWNGWVFWFGITVFLAGICVWNPFNFAPVMVNTAAAFSGGTSIVLWPRVQHEIRNQKRR